jgi:signal transduction histidine kinase
VLVFFFSASNAMETDSCQRQPTKTMKLAAKLILIFLFGVLGIVALFSWQSIRQQRHWDQHRRHAHASELVDAIKPAIAQAYRDGGTITIQQAIQYVASEVGGTQMRWVDRAEADRLPEDQVSGGRLTRVSVSNSQGTRTAYSYVPLTIDGKDTGTIEVATPLDLREAQDREALYASVLSLTGVAVFSAVVIYFGGVQLVGKPLGKLIDQVNQIGEGHWNQQPVLSNNDELGRLAVAISQMSHRLSEQRDAIRHSDRLGTVGTLAAGVAHELGTPLNVVSGRAGLIASGKLTPEEITSSAKTIRDEADRMTGIIRRLLDFARHSPSPHTMLAVGDVVTRTSELMRTLAEKSRVRIDVDLPSRPIMMRGDESQIQQILTNLISNAIQAMPDGGTVRVSVNQEGDGPIKLSVSDDGVGIAPDKVPLVFEPFYTTKDVGQGTGLGLSIAYGLVNEHGGEIKVDSTLAKGTTFTAIFPPADQSPSSATESPR